MAVDGGGGGGYVKGVQKDSKVLYERPAIAKKVPVKAVMGIVISIVI